MLTILNLFGRSPFHPLMSHMEKVSKAVHLLPSLFQAIKEEEDERISQIANQISEMEHEADLTKNDIRNHLPKGLFLPVDRSQLLEVLGLQDSIADRVEDIAVLTTLKKLTFLPEFKSDFDQLVLKNIQAFESAHEIIKELNELLESSFGGIEAEKVKTMVEKVAYLEHEGDLIQRRLLKHLFQCEEKMSYSTFDVWQKIFSCVSSISNLSEKLANRIRMTLELK